MWQDSLMCYFRPAVIYLAVEQMKGTWYLEGTFRWSLPIPSLRNANTPAVAAHPVALWLRCQHFGECGCWREVGGSMLRCRQLSIYTDNDILQGWGLDLLGVSALQCSWNRSTLRGKDFRSYSQKRTLALFWLCLSNTVRGGGSISVKGFNWRSSTQISIPSVFIGLDPAFMPRSCYFSTSKPKRSQRAVVCNS